jgi:hypothetical protein
MQKEGTIYQDQTRESLMKSLLELQNLQKDGINVGSLTKETWDQIVELIHSEDTEKLAEVRERLKTEKRIAGCQVEEPY